MNITAPAVLDIFNLRAHHELHDAFIAGAQEAGSDFNGTEQEGVGSYQLTVRKMRRCSAASRALSEAAQPRDRDPRLCPSRAVRLGKRAVGFEYAQGALVRRVGVRREVPLAGGLLLSPQLCNCRGSGRPSYCTSTVSWSYTRCAASATTCRTFEAGQRLTRPAAQDFVQGVWRGAPCR